VPQLSRQNGLGASLRRARKDLGYTQADLAKACGLTRSTVQQLERGHGRLASYHRALAALGLEIAGRNLPKGEELGSQLAQLRKRRRLSQRELAELLEIAPNTVLSLETMGKGRLETFEKVQIFLGAGLYLAPAGRRRAFYSHAGNSSVHQGWATPPALLERLYAVFGRFDLDPCSPTDDPRRAPVRARMYFTPADDGLALAWHGRVFVNPPYGRELKAWVRKAHGEAKERRASVVAVLLPARTDTAWWHEHVAGHADVFLLRGRLAFGDGEQSAPFPSALAVWGAEAETVTALRQALNSAWHIPAGRANEQ
jgi:phage N-6-adenine-methyltransferase